MTIAVQVATVSANVSPIGAAIAAVTAQITTVRPNVARVRPCRGRITSPDVLPPFAHVLFDVTTIAADFAAILTSIMPVSAQFTFVTCGITGLLRARDDGRAERQRK